MANTITTVGALQKSATKYEKDLLIMPVTAAQATLQHMQGIPGLTGNIVLGQLDGEAELGPYKTHVRPTATLPLLRASLSCSWATVPTASTLTKCGAPFMARS